MATYLDYPHIKAYYTGRGATATTLGNITFSVPDDAPELIWKYIPSSTSITDGNGRPLNVTTKDSVGLYNANNVPSPRAGYFYFIKINKKWIADRPVITYVTWNELNNAGYVNGKFRMLSYDEYYSTISTIPDPNLWNNIASKNDLGHYKGTYGEWTSTVRSSDNKVYVISNLKRETRGEIICEGDYYFNYEVSMYIEKTVRNFLWGGQGFYFMPGSYRPVIDKFPLNTLSNNIKIING